MKVLLTGGAGYIGSHVAIELLESGYEVVIADDYSNSSPEVIRKIESITQKKVSACRLDVADRSGLDSVFREHSPGCVIHLAGFKAVGESVAHPLIYYRNNLGCALCVLETMEKHGVKQIIFSSSATVYGLPENLPITEDMRTGGCTNPYGSTKHMIEQIIMDAAAAGGLSAVLLRYFNPVGAHESGLIAESPRGVPNNLMPYILQVAAGKLDELHVCGNDYPTKDGTGVRDYIHVVDLAKGHVSALDYCMKHTGTEVFNLGTGAGFSVLEIVEAFERVNGVKIPYSIAPRRPGDLPESYADASKALRLMGWRAEKTVEDMCRDTWNSRAAAIN